MNYPSTLHAAIREIHQLRHDLYIREQALESACVSMERILNEVAPIMKLADQYDVVLQDLKRDAERYRALRTKQFEPIPLQGPELDLIVDEFIETQSDAKELDL